jgi:hypothetical protein
LTALKIAWENPIENLKENPTRDVEITDFDCKRIIPVAVLNKMPTKDIWRPSQRFKIQKCLLPVESLSRYRCICSTDLSTAPKALIVEIPVVDEVKYSRISAVGPASARFTVNRALM